MTQRRAVDDIPLDSGPCVVTIGVFDGVHRGHQAVIEQARRVASDHDVPLVVLTFDPHPMSVVRPGSHPLLLAHLDERVTRLRAAGADEVLVLHFTPELAALSAETFAAEVLVGRLQARAVVVGADFRFGHRALGDVAKLRELGTQLGFEVIALDDVGEGRLRWSSSFVRDRVAAGDVAVAAVALGRPFRVEGTVVVGERRGRTIGYPTANVPLVGDFVTPPDGIYAGRLTVLQRPAGPPDDAPEETLPAAVSIGTNPTFGEHTRRLEAYVLDRNELDLYGATVAVDLVERLRDMQIFNTVEALRLQIAQDVERTRSVLG